MTSRSTSPERFNFSALGEAHPLPDLLEIQRDSFDLFMKQGLREAQALQRRSTRANLIGSQTSQGVLPVSSPRGRTDEGVTRSS